MKNVTLFIAAISLVILTGYFDPLRAQQYDRYCNDRYGFCVSYPRNFRMQPPPANDDGRRFEGPDGLIMIASGINNVSQETLETEIDSQSSDFDRITYRAKGKNWFVLSGHKGVNIVYIKTFLGRGSINHLTIEYPGSLKSKFAGVVANVARSFKAGGLRALH